MGDEKKLSSQQEADKNLLGQIYDDVYGPSDNVKKNKFIAENLTRFQRKRLELVKEYNSSPFRQEAIEQKYKSLENYIPAELTRYFTERKKLFYRIKHKFLELNPTTLALLMLGVSAVSCFGSVWAQGQFLTLSVGLPFSPIGFGLLGVGVAVNLVLSRILKESLGPEFSRKKFRAFSIGLLGVMVGLTVGFPHLFAVEGLASAASSLQILGSASLAVGFAIPLIAGFGLVCRAGWERYQANRSETLTDETDEDTMNNSSSTARSTHDFQNSLLDQSMLVGPSRPRSNSEDSEPDEEDDDEVNNLIASIDLMGNTVEIEIDNTPDAAPESKNSIPSYLGISHALAPTISTQQQQPNHPSSTNQNPASNYFTNLPFNILSSIASRLPLPSAPYLEPNDNSPSSSTGEIESSLSNKL